MIILPAIDRERSHWLEASAIC